MNEIIQFDYHQQNIRVIQDEAGNPWWIATDVCNILNLTDVAKSLDRLEDDEKLVRKLFVSGQNRPVWIINEPGLYTLIIRSNKPEAKRFKRWITHEVLPSIRKKGYYAIPDHGRIDSIVPITREFISAKRLASAVGFRGNKATLEANSRVKEVLGVDCIAFMGAEHLFEKDGELYPLDDMIMDYIDDQCDVKEGAQIGASVLYEDFTDWYEDNALPIPCPTQAAFGRHLKRHFRGEKKGGIVRYYGLTLKRLH